MWEATCELEGAVAHGSILSSDALMYDMISLKLQPLHGSVSERDSQAKMLTLKFKDPEVGARGKHAPIQYRFN